MIELKPCPMCGSEAKFHYGGATIECYGWDWQTMSIECTDSNNKHCDMNLSLSADYYYVEGNIAEGKMIELWNLLYETKIRKT
jgi:hypothetical protein